MELSTTLPGTFTATSFIFVNGQKEWVNDDIMWRVPIQGIETLNVKQVPIDKVNARIDSDEISTISDMLEDSELSYNLTQLHNQGVNCLWLQAPYRIDPWKFRHEVDTAGSDYASNDWLSVDPEISLKARNIPEWDKDLRHKVANEEMKTFVDKAHGMGIKVVFGIAPNHVGHNYVFRDFFVDERIVKSRDYSQIAIKERIPDTEHLIQKYQGTEIADFAEYIYPFMYAAKDKDGKYNPTGGFLFRRNILSPIGMVEWA